MEKTPSSSDSNSTLIQNTLKSLNRSSFKISKPPITNRIPNPNPNPNPNSNPNPNPNPNPSPSPNPNPNPNPNQSQPPVYNIDKNDFREIVQKLTGSPAHLRPSPSEPPPPPQPTSSADAPPPPFSRLHRIRPPPLSHLSARPATPAAFPALSPLPPLPTVSASAESPITAYMRRLRGGPSPTTTSAPPPLSPLGFGCGVLPSPRTAAAAYGMMLSPSLLMPTSPRMPAPSPR